MLGVVPLSIPNFEGNELKYVTNAISEGWVSTGGAYITELENKISEFIHTEGAVACQSGTAAIHLALIECGVKKDELVIVPTLTFIAAVNPVRYVGADPVFMDCDDSLCMDPVKLRSFCELECKIEGGILTHKKTKKKIRAIIVVHVFGNMADMENIIDIAREYHLRVIEDATEALGTKYEIGRYAEKYAGTIGDFGAFSFNGNKIITTGGGGMLVAKNVDQLKHLRYLSTQAKDDALFYIHDEVGYNYRMTNVQAAIGVAQMEELPEFISRKNKNYELYNELLADWDGGYLLNFRRGTRSNKWFYSLFIQQLHKPMNELIYELSENGVQTRAIWGLVHLQKPYIHSIAYGIEQASYYSDRIINLPCSTNIMDSDINKVCNVVKKIC